MSEEPRFDLVPGHGGTDIGVHRLGKGFPVVMMSNGLASRRGNQLDPATAMPLLWSPPASRR